MITVYFLLSVIPVILVFRFVSVWVNFTRRRRILKKIPCPPGHWFWGHLQRDLWNNTDQLFDVLREYARDYWPIYRFEAVGITTVNLLHPNDIEIVLSKHMKKSILYKLLHKWLGQGLITSTGEKWQTRRKILTPTFHFNILKQFLTVFNDVTDKLVKQLEENCNEPCIDVLPLVTHFALQTIGETAMGLSEIEESAQNTYKASLCSLMKLLITKLVTPWYHVRQIYRFTKLYKEEIKTTNYLHDFAYQVIKSREKKLLKQHRDKEDNGGDSNPKRKVARMLDLLLMAKMDGSDIDLEGIREEVDTFMFAGHDTTSLTTTFLLLLLSNHPNVQEKVRQEITDIVGSRVPTYEDLQQLKYTERVIKETLRIFPIAPFISRVAGDDFTTHTGYYIPKGTILHIHIFDLHHDPRIYPDPLKFDPDRFLPENCQRHPYAYIPFSAGPRNCIGQKYALLQLKAVLCGVLRKFTLHEVDKAGDISFYPDLVLRPKTGIRIRFVPK